MLGENDHSQKATLPPHVPYVRSHTVIHWYCNTHTVIHWYRNIPFLRSSGCLRLWLEQDTVCPTCRWSLSSELQTRERRGGEVPGERREEGEGEGARGRWRRFHRPRNWLLHFNGASIASWLPTFSVELHEDGLISQDLADLHRGVSPYRYCC